MKAAVKPQVLTDGSIVFNVIADGVIIATPENQAEAEAYCNRFNHGLPGTVSQAVEDAALRSSVNQLRRQNELLVMKVAKMADFISAFPMQIVHARLDAKEGRETKYDYATHNQILALPVS